MQRRTLLAAAGVGVLGSIAGCADDAADEQAGDDPAAGDDAGGGSDGDDDAADGADDDAGDGSDGDDAARTPPEAAVESYLIATGEGDAATANELYHGEGEFVEEMEPTPGATVVGVAECGDEAAIRESTNASRTEAEEIVAEMAQERERVLAEDPAVDDLVYVFAAITAEDMAEIRYVVTAVEVDGEWRVLEERRLA